ncbi:hypothetical protein SAMN05421877_10939 [Sphingobacterium lactis]|uniref:Uncharacterized protein n=1 Tax=Sphingobacterium lactis TaxID=797291 RepID=A0A1H6AZY2_9SPHI|nr:hypothetical protein SAMN05421877_10939 [Sphingobacterium lactis]
MNVTMRFVIFSLYLFLTINNAFIKFMDATSGNNRMFS